MTISAKDLPTDALVSIFSYLKATESISCRGVCQKWSGTAGAGTIQVQVRRCFNDSSRQGNNGRSQCNNQGNTHEDIIGSVTLVGRVKSPDNEGGVGVVTTHSNSIPERRIRGHLPSPSSQVSQDMSNTIPAYLSFACDGLSENDREYAYNSAMLCTLTTKHPCNAAIQIENILSFFVTIDLSSSSSKFQYGVSEKNKNHIHQTICKEKKVRSLRSSITRIDISCLKHLRVISVGGCGCLKSLLLPKSIQSVDAKGCSELFRIGFPNGCDGSLQSLDLNGCRKLKRFQSGGDRLFGVNTADVFCNITHSDMSQLPKEGLLNEEFCRGLRSTNHLQMFSLRYCASDAIITALADSQSARSGQLRLVDIAFSIKVTDESVKLLARNSPALERINMRGCKGITGECYNNIPVYLERRRRRGGSGGETVCEEEEMDESFPSSRKGDNLFFFCKK